MPPDEVAEPIPPKWEAVTEPRIVYRFLKQPDPDADDFAEKNFRSDEECGKTPLAGEHPDLLAGMSVFNSEAAARKRYAEVRNEALKKRSDRNRRRNRPIKMRIGEHIGEVLLVAGEDFELVDEDDPDGHMTLRGDKDRLAARVGRIYPAARQST